MWLSIIIPTYYDDLALKNLLGQLAQFDLDDVEIIIVDGQVRDHPEWIPKRVNYFSIKHANRGIQLHLGGALASGQYLWFLHADSKFEVDPIVWLKKHAPELGYCQLQFDDPGKFFKIMSFGSNLRASVGKLVFGDQSFFISAQIYQQVGGFSEQPLMEDYEMSRRLKQLGFQFTQLPITIITSSRKYQQEGHLRLFLKMQVYKLAYALGVSPKILIKYYYGRKND